MTTKEALRCGPCDNRGIKNDPEVWCPNCDEGLCSNCSQYHGASKSLRKHVVMPIESFNSLPESMRFSRICTSHGELLELFCGKHQEPCCSECMLVNHSTCPGVNLFSKIAKGIKSSERLERTKDKLFNLTKYTIDLKKNRNENIVNIDKRTNEIIGEVKLSKESAIKRLNDIELELRENLETLATNEKKECLEATRKLASHQVKLDSLEKMLEAAIDQGSEEHAYYAILQLDAELSKEETELRQLSENIKDTEMRLTLNDGFREVLSLFSLGNISIEHSETNIEYKGDRVPSAQIERSGPVDSDISLIRITKLKTVTENKNSKLNTRSLLQTPDGNILSAAANYDGKHGCVYKYASDGECIEQFSFKPPIFDLAYFDQRIIMSSSVLGESFFVEFEDGILKKTGDAEVRGNVFGMSTSNKDSCIAIAIRGKGIRIFDKELTVMKEVPTNIKYLAYIHIKDDNLFYSDFDNHYLYCINFDGNEVWKCSFPEMKGPRNICSDMHGNIYVAALDSNAVCVISSDGSKCRQILDSSNGMREPKAIYFNNETSQLIVANKTGTLFICSVVYQTQ